MLSRLAGRTISILGESISNIASPQLDEIQPVPPLRGAMETDYILGLVSVSRHLGTLVDIDKLRSMDEMGRIDKTILAA